MITKIRLIISVLAAFYVVGVSAASDQIRIISLEPTVLFPKRVPLVQIARMTVVNTSSYTINAEATVSIEGQKKLQALTITLVPNQSIINILVPDIENPAKVSVEVISHGAVLARYEQVWNPQRKWKVHVVKASHEDLGYENYIFRKQKEIADFIDLAREQSSPKSVAGNIGSATTMKISPYHYTMETLLFQRNYIEERGEIAWRALVEKDVKTGHMSLEGAPSGVHSHWMDYEELARMTYPARRETKDRFGLDLKTYMIVDNPSLSWSGVQALADAGFKYVARWGQSWRSGGNNDYATTKVPAIFWWVGPNGSSKALFSWRSHYSNGFWFGQTSSYSGLIELAAGNVSEFLKKVEDGSFLGPYPYDAMITPEYIDHDIPRFDMRILPLWRESYSYPEILVSGPETFFEYIEKNFSKSIPVLSGDLNNFSADYSSIDPKSQGLKRRAAHLLPAVEGLAVISSSINSGFALSTAAVERLYTRMFDYDEHSWPTQPRGTDEQLFNAAWVKNHEASRLTRGVDLAFKDVAAAFALNIPSKTEGSIAVFNPLVHTRTDLVEVEGSAFSVMDMRSGAIIQCEQVADQKFRFLATNIPAFGYALYQINNTQKLVTQSAELKADRYSISNKYYTVSFNHDNGSVTSIIDHTNNRELIDPKAPYLANQLVYVHKNEREAKEGYEYSPSKAFSLESHLTTTHVSFDIKIDDPKLGGTIHQTVTLHAGVKRVDFQNRLESIDVMWAPTYEDRYRDNLFYAFPFNVRSGQIRAEYPGGVVRPYLDQLRWGSHDYLYANRWIDVSNTEGGVTLASTEAGTFSLGEIRYNKFAIDYQPTKPWVFSYAWSNRMAGLLTLQPDDCNATFNYSLTSHEGDWDSGAATKHGWQYGSPLLAISAKGGPEARWKENEKSFLAVDVANVQLTVLKASGIAGRGWIARFVETNGHATEFEIDASFLGAQHATLCDLVENDGASLSVKDGKIKVSIKPFSFATVRLISGKTPSAIENLRAPNITDSTIQLKWSASVGEDEAFNIYRSDDPAAPATVYTLVARTTASEYFDRDLNLATKYYYHVAKVSAANIQGQLSPALVVLTSAENKTAPAPVNGLGVVRRSADTLILYWSKNQEPDVARYRIFRGETENFAMEGNRPIAEIPANHDFLQIYRDTGLKPDHTYFYRVQPVDWADNHQAISPITNARTPKDRP